MAPRPRPVIIGAGHNGLVAALRLARAGLRPIVLEARAHAGGLLGDPSLTVAFMPGSLMEPICRDLGIDLPLRPMGIVVTAPGRPPVRVRGSVVEGTDPSQARAWKALQTRLRRQAGALAPLVLRPPVGFAGVSGGDLLAIARTALKLRLLGKQELRELLRILLSNAQDLVDDELGDGLLGGLIAMEATLGGAMGPCSPGTVLPLLYRLAAGGNGRMVPLQAGRSAPAIIIETLCTALTAAGGEIRTAARVDRLLVAGDRVRGVRLADGSSIESDIILSSAAPRTTFLDLLGVEHLDAEFARRCRTIASSGMAARLDFALAEPPLLADGRALQPDERLVIAPSSRAVDQAFDAAKHGHVPAAPVMEAGWQAGTLSVTVQFVPCTPSGGWTATMRAELEARVRAQLVATLPGTGDGLGAGRSMTPQDIAQEYRLPGGHWHHVELRIDQLAMLRPFDGAAAYRAPVRGLFLCGAGAHPGGDITGAPGYVAAGVVLAEAGLA